MHAHTDAHKRVHAHTHTCTHTHTHAHACTHASTQIYTYTHKINICTHTHTHTRTRKHTYVHTHTHTHAHTGREKALEATRLRIYGTSLLAHSWHGTGKGRAKSTQDKSNTSKGERVRGWWGANHQKESFRTLHNLLRNMESVPVASARCHSEPLHVESGECESGTMFALDALSFDWD